MEQIIFVVWRESIEALLVVGILYSWLKQFGADGTLRYLWFGVTGGVVAALALAGALLGMQQFLSGNGQEIFMLVMMLTAMVLIVHMVLWMREHGRHLHSHFRDQTRKAINNQTFWSISILVAVAIAREGSETVIFLYGMSYAQQSMQDWVSFTGAVALALALAGLTYYLLQAGRYWLSWKHFFRVTEIMLLLLASALLLSAIDKMIGLGWIPAGVDPLWDTSALLSDSSRLGGVISALTGYRAYPALTDVVAWVGFWAVIVGLFKYQSRQSVSATA
ncbi:OFeT family iron transporter [Marinobacter santoriniensis NKSG1]|uniref:OFeT family iron transporter n=1 Tax=Marinobacter santoriniensis NKSG1 TaxID=1288826 RepID=M7CSK7_9GAMM|nr:FTR1 family protein [Marinobacter santoriniensis]EMP56596.1 OFeT family iron transporter [Marinobacter santoriniensis NKSG1]